MLISVQFILIFCRYFNTYNIGTPSFFHHQRGMNLADEQTETKLLVINLPIGISNKNVDVYDRLLVSFGEKKYTGWVGH